MGRCVCVCVCVCVWKGRWVGVGVWVRRGGVEIICVCDNYVCVERMGVGG